MHAQWWNKCLNWCNVFWLKNVIVIESEEIESFNVTLTRNEHPRCAAHSLVLQREKWVDSLPWVKRRDKSKLDEIDRRLEHWRFAFCYVYDSRNTRICRSALTAIFWHRKKSDPGKTRHRARRKTRRFQVQLSHSRASRHRREGIALQVRCSSTFNRPDWCDDDACKFFGACLFSWTFTFDFTSFPREA